MTNNENNENENNENENKPQTFTREQLDAIVKDTITKKDAEIDALKNAQELKNKSAEVYKIFKKNGGQKNAFDDFWKTNSETLLKSEKLENDILDIKKTKTYFFKDKVEIKNESIEGSIKKTLENDFSTPNKKTNADLFQGSSLYRKN